jgi:hypothetical protein
VRWDRWIVGQALEGESERFRFGNDFRGELASFIIENAGQSRFVN